MSNSFLNSVAKGYEKASGAIKEPKAEAAETPQAAVHTELSGKICPDCHDQVKSVMEKHMPETSSEPSPEDKATQISKGFNSKLGSM